MYSIFFTGSESLIFLYFSVIWVSSESSNLLTIYNITIIVCELITSSWMMNVLNNVHISDSVVLLSTHSLDPCLWVESDHPAFGPPASLSSIWPAAPSLQRGLSTNPGVTMWCVFGCSCRDGMCHVCGCYRGGIVVMDVIFRRLCVSMI